MPKDNKLRLVIEERHIFNDFTKLKIKIWCSNKGKNWEMDSDKWEKISKYLDKVADIIKTI